MGFSAWLHHTKTSGLKQSLPDMLLTEQERCDLFKRTLFFRQYFWHLFLWKPCLCCYNGFFGTFSTKLCYCNVKHNYDESSAPFLVLVVDHSPKENKLYFLKLTQCTRVLKCWATAFYNVYLHPTQTPTPHPDSHTPPPPPLTQPFYWHQNLLHKGKRKAQFSFNPILKYSKSQTACRYQQGDPLRNDFHSPFRKSFP